MCIRDSTADCSPKDAPYHGGAGPHHSLARALAATLRGSERVQKEIARRRFDAVRERFDALLRRDASRAAPDGAAKPPPGDARVDADDDDGACALFFVPFVPETRTTRELRCFVHDRVLTAISQYDWFSPTAIFCSPAHALLRTAFCSRAHFSAPRRRGPRARPASGSGGRKEWK